MADRATGTPQIQDRLEICILLPEKSGRNSGWWITRLSAGPSPDKSGPEGDGRGKAASLDKR